MSTPLAIAAVTSSLRTLLLAAAQKVDVNAGVTLQPPDKAQVGDNKLNLFLYHVAVNPALRNNPELPGLRRPGENGAPPLALDLYYLVTAYGRGDPKFYDDHSHRLLGRAMAALHDHPVMLRDELKTALADAQVHLQVERVRITPYPLSLEEMSKLWTTFQTQYRISVAYQVSVVLIESEIPPITPLPVLSIGPGPRGAQVEASLAPPLPTLLDLVLPPWSSEPLAGLLPARRPSARLEDLLALEGLHLDGMNLQVFFAHPLLAQPNQVAPEAGATAGLLNVKLPNLPADWPAGMYTVSLALTRQGERRTTNGLPLALAPEITSRTPATTNQKNFNITLGFRPRVRPGQQVKLLFGSQELLPNAFTTPTGSLVFAVKNAVPGVYPLRLHIDDVESILIRLSGSPPVPGFDPDQTIEVTA
jgi:hypothetical protein